MVTWQASGVIFFFLNMKIATTMTTAMITSITSIIVTITKRVIPILTSSSSLVTAHMGTSAVFNITKLKPGTLKPLHLPDSSNVEVDPTDSNDFNLVTVDMTMLVHNAVKCIAEVNPSPCHTSPTSIAIRTPTNSLFSIPESLTPSPITVKISSIEKRFNRTVFVEF